MIRKFSILLTIVMFGTRSTSNAQCNCKETFSNIITSIEANYIGFYKKTEQSKKKYNSYKNKLIKASFNADFFNCYKLVNKYFSYFSEPHLSTTLNYNKQTEEFFKEIFSKLPVFPNWESKLMIENVSEKNKENDLVGLWVLDSNYKIQIFQTKKNKFTGVIRKADNIFWFPGQVKLKIDLVKSNSSLTLYRRDHLPQVANFSINDGILNIVGFGSFKKSYNDTFAEPVNTGFYFDQLNPSTCILTLPNFLMSSKAKIDSLVTTNQDKLGSCENLIIDLRNNGGGFSSSFDTLLPYIYSGNIKQYSFSVLASEDNIKLYESFGEKNNLLNDPDYSLLIQKLKDNVNSLVAITQSQELIIDKVLLNPKRIVFLTNKGTASAAEALLLVARQSKKTIIMGGYTRGALDNQNVLMAREIPGCLFFKYYCPVATSSDGPKIDNIGIKPDIIVDANENLISTALRYLSKQQ